MAVNGFMVLPFGMSPEVNRVVSLGWTGRHHCEPRHTHARNRERKCVRNRLSVVRLVLRPLDPDPCAVVTTPSSASIVVSPANCQPGLLGCRTDGPAISEQRVRTRG
jgi:hypothetical protein